MILVTVGTTMPFDELLVEVDRLAGAGLLEDDVICQSGQSKYQMVHARQFIGLPSLTALIEQSSLVISHGGATVIQLLLARKPFVAFPNPRGAGDHQGAFLEKISASTDISWSRNVAHLLPLIEKRRLDGPSLVSSDLPRVSTLILQQLDFLKPSRNARQP